jgi:GT2 family glycosyltransferase
MSAAGVISDLPDDLAGRDYDLTSRHVLVASLIQALLPAGGRILDIGGADGLTARTLPRHSVITLDVLSGGVDVVASGAQLPFRAGSFAACVVLDVLEHVPALVRAELIEESARIADVLVFTGPLQSPEVEAAEAHQRHVFEAMFGRPHPWLQEHADCGLPSRVAVETQLGNLGFSTVAFGSNPLGLWSALLFNSHVALRLGLDTDTRPLRSGLLRDFLNTADGTAPSYRHIVVAARGRPDLDEIAFGIAPQSSPRLVSEAIAKTEITTGRVIDSGMRLLESARQELAAGWEDTMEMVNRLRRENAAKIDEYDSALDAARAGWKNSVDRIGELEENLHAVDQALVDANRALVDANRAQDRLEELLLLDPDIWRRPLSGPPVQAATAEDVLRNPVEPYHRWIERHPTSAEITEPGPRFSLIVPVFNPIARFLEAVIRSVRNQTYPQWELILYDVSTEPHVDPICRRFAALDDRIRVVQGDNLGIAANTNTAAAAASGEWLALLDHDDLLAPEALSILAASITASPEADFVYSDEDKIDGIDHRSDPFFKPGWSPDLLRTVNYITHLAAIRRNLWERVEGMREGFDGAQDYELFLRATHEASRIEHVPEVLYHWRVHEGSTAGDVRQKPQAHRAGRKALESFLDSTEPGAWVEPGPGPTSHRVRYPVRRERVSIIMPFKDGAELTEKALTAIDRYRFELPFEVLLVSNRSEEPSTLESIEAWQARWTWVRTVEYDRPFNFQSLNNWAVGQTDGPLLLFLNNDAEPIHAGWLEALAEHAQRPAVGAVGGRLFYPDGRVQHAGVAVGIGGYADHPWKGLHPDAWTPAGPSYWTRNFLAVTAACLMIERAKFAKVGGFNERFVVGGGDVDLGLRLVEAGYWNVMTPWARLIHHESVTRGTSVPESDLIESRRVYGPYLAGGDPFYNRNLSLDGTDPAVKEG